MVQPKGKYTVVGIGEVLWDIYRDRRHLGGAPANFTIHSAQLGDHGILVSRVGDDGMGRELIRTLQQRNLSSDFIQIDPKRGTGTVMITLDVKGVPSFRCSRDVAFDYLEYTSAEEALAQHADVVFFGTLAQRSPITRKTVWRFLRAAKKAVKVLDVKPLASAAELQQIVPASLEIADILKMNEEEIRWLKNLLRRESDNTRKFVDFLIKKYRLKMAAVTYGEFGCEIFDGSAAIRMEGLPVRAVDTTGAGDAFTAGLVHKFLRGAPLPEMAEFANSLGAFLCTQRGATPAFQWQEIEAFRESL
jgi:fructokinase